MSDATKPGTRLTASFETLRKMSRKALIPYITAGDPDPDKTVELMHALVAGGADILELGVPFSDPMADGPVIQRACERALARGTRLRRVLEMVAQFRAGDPRTPVVLMGYLNPIETMGRQAFVEAARRAGVDGVLIVDLSLEESQTLAPQLRAAGLDCVFLLAPNTDAQRISAIAAQASGYLYYVSLKGVTGSDRLDAGDVGAHIAEIRRHSDLPIAVGFGVRDGASAQAVARVADAVVVGSVLVAEIERHADRPSALPGVLTARLRGLREAIDQLEVAA